MRNNEKVILYGTRILLVPYEAHHVPKYHGWMESPELRELTASERLSLPEEYKMQQQWREDTDKCTFIVLDRQLFEESAFQERQKKEIEAMVGDVNIFYPPGEQNYCQGEVEIMIAESSARGKGFGKEALCTMMRYGQQELKTFQFTSKIGFENRASLHLFETLGFKEVSKSDVFQEITLQLDASHPNVFSTWTPGFSIKMIE